MASRGMLATNLVRLSRRGLDSTVNLSTAGDLVSLPVRLAVASIEVKGLPFDHLTPSTGATIGALLPGEFELLFCHDERARGQGRNSVIQTVIQILPQNVKICITDMLFYRGKRQLLHVDIEEVVGSSPISST